MGEVRDILEIVGNFQKIEHGLIILLSTTQFYLIVETNMYILP